MVLGELRLRLGRVHRDAEAELLQRVREVVRQLGEPPPVAVVLHELVEVPLHERAMMCSHKDLVS